MRSKQIALLIIAVALAASPAAAEKARPALEDVPAPEAADQTLGMALMSAFVSPAGTLLGGAGAQSATRTATGVFRIAFVRGVSGCNYVAGVGRTDGFNNPSGIATAWWFSATDGVLVRTFDFDGTPDDHPFQVIVFCAR